MAHRHKDTLAHHDMSGTTYTHTRIYSHAHADPDTYNRAWTHKRNMHKDCRKKKIKRRRAIVHTEPAHSTLFKARPSRTRSERAEAAAQDHP